MSNTRFAEHEENRDYEKDRGDDVLGRRGFSHGQDFIRFAVLLVATFVLSVGCKAQVPPNPTVYTCQASTGTVYTPLNQATPATGLSFTDSTVTPGQWCYVVQSAIGNFYSLPSNTAGPVVVPSGDNVAVSWTAPATGPTPTGYVVSRVAATQSTLAPPVLTANPQVALAAPTPAEKLDNLFGNKNTPAPTHVTVRLVAQR